MTINSQPSSAKRLRLAAVGILLTVAAAMTITALGVAAPANAVPPPPPPPPGASAGPYVAIAFSPDNGAHGWANNAASQREAEAGALQNCRNFGGDQCGIDAWSQKQCAAIAVMTPATTPNHQWGAHHGTWGATIADANANASAANGGGEVMVARCATGDDGWG